MKFPNNKKFAFTIIDDTDGATVQNIRPVYDFLSKLGMKTTKTVWAMPPKDRFQGMSLENYPYRQFIKKIQRQGFEIAFHSAASGKITREETLKGLEAYKRFIGRFPEVQVNHGRNPDSIYWGIKRFSLTKPFWRFSRFQGDDKKTPYFWGDCHKKYIKFTRNFTYSSLDTTAIDSNMPYVDKGKAKYSNYWFSSSDGADVKKFNQLISSKNVESLVKKGGVAIIYTHFASGFVQRGRLDPVFQRQMNLIAKKEGWFVPASDILNFLLKNGRGKEITSGQHLRLELRWVWSKLTSMF